jgi:Mn2+/Fe2+ NRAMP family transporter
MKALFWSAVINGVVAVPLLVVIILLASNKQVMGSYTAPKIVIGLGWVTVFSMGLAALWMLLPS